MHNIVGFPLIDSVAMVSPLVMQDLVCGTSKAINQLVEKTSGPIRAVNLCASLLSGSIDEGEIVETVCKKLLETRGASLNS